LNVTTHPLHAAVTRRRATCGFTLVELLVVIAIIGVLIALLLPAVQAAREAARRSACTNKLKQSGLAIQNYHAQFKTFPPGATRHQAAGQTGVAWRVLILPQLEQQELYDRIGVVANGGATDWSWQTEMPEVFQCPSTQPATIGVSTMKSASYWGIAGTLRPDGKGLTLSDTTCGNLHRNGVFFPGSRTKIAKIEDGTSNTIAIGERTYTFRAWMTGSTWSGNPLTRYCSEGANHVAYPLNPSHDDFGYFVGHNPLPTGGKAIMPLNDLPFGSTHPGGALFALADGSVQLLRDDLDQTIFESMATIAGGEVVPELR
jgi:prepilin-type N-terminal cleavage/methylation domain-containing protein